MNFFRNYLRNASQGYLAGVVAGILGAAAVFVTDYSRVPIVRSRLRVGGEGEHVLVWPHPRHAALAHGLAGGIVELACPVAVHDVAPVPLGHGRATGLVAQVSP